MTYRCKTAALVAATAMIAAQTVPAAAEGVTAGTTITNTVTVDFRVGNVDQTAVVDTDAFQVDRKINFVVTRVSDPATSVAPGQSGAVIAFDVSNLSNDTIDLALAAIQPGTDDFDADNVTIYIDDGDNIFTANDTAAALIDELAQDAAVRVFVVSNIPLSATNGDIADLLLSATAHAGATPGGLGTILASSSGANTIGVETVLADGAGDDDSSNDGVFTAAGQYTVMAANLSVAKTSIVLTDPVNGTADPKAIPGAVIEYCIAVSNAAAAATATNIVVTDVLPAQLAFDTVFGIRINGTLGGSQACQADGVAGGSYAAGTATVTAPLNDIAAGQAATVYFRATIN